MQNLTKRERIFMAIASLWLFMNIIIYYMSKPIGLPRIVQDKLIFAKSTFYPFQAYHYKYNEGTGHYVLWDKITDTYDFTELLIYGISPLVLFAIYKLFLKNEKN